MTSALLLILLSGAEQVQQNEPGVTSQSAAQERARAAVDPIRAVANVFVGFNPASSVGHLDAGLRSAFGRPILTSSQPLFRRIPDNLSDEQFASASIKEKISQKLKTGILNLKLWSQGSCYSLGRLRPVRAEIRRRCPDVALDASALCADVSPEHPLGVRVWPCWDALDKRIFKQAIPTIINFLSLPLAGAIDNAFIGMLANPLANAGQLAGDQVYMTAGLFTEALPSATRPIIAKAHAAGNKNEVALTVGAAISLSVILGAFVTLIVGLGSHWWLLGVGSKAALSFSVPYLLYRLPGVIPSTVSLVGFSSLQAVMDSVTPITVSVVSLVLNAVFNYLLMFPVGLHIAGAALATAVSQIAAGMIYLAVLLRRQLVNWSSLLRPPSYEMLMKFAPAMGALQVQSIARQVVFAAVTKVTQELDNTGIAAAAHAITINFWQLGGVVLYAMQFAASTLISAELGKKDSTPAATRAVAQRLLAWGALMGCMMAALQLLGLPLLSLFHRCPEVHRAARVPSVIGAALQLINGVAFVGEGVMLAAGAVGVLAIGRVAAAAGMLLALRLAPSTLVGVWNCFWVYTSVRLIFFLSYFWYAKSPLLPEGRPPPWVKHKSV